MSKASKVRSSHEEQSVFRDRVSSNCSTELLVTAADTANSTSQAPRSEIELGVNAPVLSAHVLTSADHGGTGSIVRLDTEAASCKSLTPRLRDGSLPTSWPADLHMEDWHRGAFASYRSGYQPIELVKSNSTVSESDEWSSNRRWGSDRKEYSLATHDARAVHRA